MLTPTYYFGKGFGDLPDSAGWLRAFAVTGQIGYQIPSRSFDVVQQAFIPQVLAWSGSIQYSMPYLKSEIIDLQLPDFINHLIPIVEFQMSTPAANNFGNSFVTTGTINPGVIWVGSYFQVGLEAQVPVNAQSGHGIGVLGQLHLYLDDMFPKTIGQPLIGGRRPRRNSSSSEVSPCENFSSLVSLLFIALAPTAAQAHAFLDHASPLVGSTVPTAPHEVALTFTQNLEPAFSTAQVTDSSGARVDQGKAQVSGNTMTIGLKALGPGSYKVHWHALSVDTHTTEGTFTFHVGGH